MRSRLLDIAIAFAALLLSTIGSFSQDHTVDFSWVGLESNSSSIILTNVCGEDIEVTLTTGIAHTGINANEGSVLIPFDTDILATSIPVSIEFSQEVTDLDIHVLDIDENVNGNPVEEYFTNLQPFPTDASGELTISGETVDSNLDPDAAENDAAGWIHYTGQTAAAYTFDYIRPLTGYGVFLAELSFNCPCEAAPTSFLLPEIQDFNGTAIQVSDNEIDACVGDSFCISAAAINTDPEVSVLIESDFESLLPGGEFSAQEGNAATAELCLETTSEMVGTSVITLSAGPSVCPGFTGDQVEIILNVSPEVELLTDDAVICAGDELPAVASGAVSYVWTPLEGDMSSISGDGAEQVLSPDVTTTYVVSSPDVNPACDAADTLLVEVSLSEIELDVTNESCIGDDGEISVSVSGGSGPFVFEWDELDSSGSSVTDLGDGTYGLTVSDASLPGCSIDTLIFVDGFIQASAALNAGDLLCAGESSLVEMVISGAGPFEVGYSIGEEASVASGVNSSVELVVTPLSNTEVCLNDITDVNGCVTMIDTCVSLDVIENAVAAFDWEPNPLSNIYSEVQFTNLSSGASDFQWSFSELGSSVEASPVVDLSPLSSCAFEACLFASNEGLCADSVCHVIPVALDAPVYMPNVFTPNNDGVNELFLPVFADEQCIDEMTFRVWNRWGEKIFETNTPGDGWNGSYKQGKYYVSDGVYIWELLYRPLSSAEQERLTGTVSVLR